MPAWLYTVVDLWPVLSSLTPVILLAGFYWLRTKFPDKADFDALKVTVEQIELDQTSLNLIVKRLDEERDSHPSRIHLLEELGTVESRVKSVETGQLGLSMQLKTANEYLQILVERGLSK